MSRGVLRDPAGAAPLPQADQAAGLRRLFAGRQCQFVPLVANPYVTYASVLLERLTTALAQARIPVLLVDAAETSPKPPDVATLDLAACIEQLDPYTAYLAGRGLPRAHVDTRGNASRLLPALANAAPGARVIFVHGEANDLARVFQGVDARPMLLAADRVDAVKHAYAAAKVLVQRAGLMTCDLIMSAPQGSRRARAIASSLADTIERYLGALLADWAQIDPAVDVAEAPGDDLQRLLLRQIQLGMADGPASIPPRSAAAPITVFAATN